MQITAILLGLLLPAFAYSAYLIAHNGAVERARHLEGAVDQARRIQATIDRELASQLLVVRVLAASAFVQSGNLEEFHRRAVDAKRIINADVVVKNNRGDHLINTRRPWGDPIKAALTEADRRALETGVPTISNLYTSSLFKERIVSLNVPTRLGSHGPGLVNIGLSPGLLRDLMQQMALPEEWVAAVIDGNDRVVARSRHHERFLGEQVTETLRTNTTRQEGVWLGTTLDGVAVVSTFARSQVAPGWRVVVGVPTAVFEAPVQRSLFSLVMVGFVILSGAIGVAGWYAERLAGALARVSGHAKQVGEGKVLEPSTSTIREIAEVEQALSLAATRLQDRTRALEENERRLRLTLEAGKMGTWDWNLSTGAVHLDEMGCRIWGVEPASGTRLVEFYFQLVDPLDIEMLKKILGQTIERNTPYRHEFRIRHSDGSVKWLAGRGVLIGDDQGRLTRMIGINFDITEMKLSEERTAGLLAELNHRVKNSLAVLDAIANRTMLDAPTPAAFFEAFSGRLGALAASHALLAESGWQGVDVGRLVESQTAPYAGSDKGRIRCSGPLVQLGSDLSLALAFVLHELATNAAKHGALSVPTGRLDVTWERIGANGDEALHLIWVERDGPPVVLPTRQGYGSRLISQSLSYAFKGEVTQSYAPEGLTTKIKVRLAP